MKNGQAVGRSVGRGLVLAILVAGGAVACGDAGPDHIQQVQELADSADQMLITMRTSLTQLGVRQADLLSDTAFLYENSGRADLRKVTIHFFTANGVESSVLTSDTGIYFIRTGQMEARGNVFVRRSDGATLTTSMLRYDQTQNKVSTTEAYTYTEGDRRVQGQGFVSDPTFSNITTQGVRGTGGRFTLPGQ